MLLPVCIDSYLSGALVCAVDPWRACHCWRMIYQTGVCWVPAGSVAWARTAAAGWAHFHHWQCFVGHRHRLGALLLSGTEEVSLPSKPAAR